MSSKVFSEGENTAKVLSGSRGVGESKAKGAAPRAKAKMSGRSIDPQGVADCRPMSADRKQSAK